MRLHAACCVVASVALIAAGCAGAAPAQEPAPLPAAGATGSGGSAAERSEANVAAIFEGGCATTTARAELTPSNLLFVIDRSSSMACNPPPTTASAACELDSVRKEPLLPSKWEIVRGALRHAVEALPDSTFAGLSYFSNDDACGVHSVPSVEIAQLSSAQRSAIDVSLANVQPKGATPLVGAVILAYRHLHSAALAGVLTGNKFVVLLTDGEQSDACSDPQRCNDAQQCTDQLISSEVPEAAGPGVGIKTFVIGAPGSEPARRVLSQIAVLGGTSQPGCSVEQGTCHFDMTRRPEFGAALAEALATIAGRTLSCELPLPSSIDSDVDPSRVNVVYTPSPGAKAEVILKDDRAACNAGANGWQYAGAGRLRLCGPACDRIRTDLKARVDVVLGCRVRVPQ